MYTEVLEHIEDGLNLKKAIWHGTSRKIAYSKLKYIFVDKISLTIGTLKLDTWRGIFYRRNTSQLPV